ncbi:methylated-DNA--[protein]-cysteine S-methyltransferase [Inquilinus limosus]|uniref:methylated-DNA--[protein]-cysteine S-methyltransferase n=1 Tax=Inquilinus limosus TaxID=171674 RepID=UPI0004076922|nr:methylated-DNA--[protein]-cysteine S-methyltransferase [Inquilinus limosus]
MSEHLYTLFETALGTCGIAWGLRGITGVQLPGSSAATTRTRLLRRCPGAEEGEPTPEIRQVIDRITALLRGEPAELSAVPLDLDRVPEFERRVYAIARGIPPGSTMTYGEIAKRLGDPLLARDVGQAMGHNPFPIVVPCHRVLAAGGKPGGFSAPGGVDTKMRMLRIEGAAAAAQASLFDL